VDPRFDRLESENHLIMALNKDSDRVRVEPLEVLPGWVPERYKVTFHCRGIARIDEESQRPEYSDWHEVEINCDEQFPSDVPRLRWLTPVWHPNIEHEGDKRVCVNKSEWLGGMGLDELCKQMFEMVQYKNYHAEFTPPYPFDPKAAKWVREFAEPEGIVNKDRGIFVDNVPFYKANAMPTSRLRLVSSRSKASSGRHIKIHSVGSDSESTTEPIAGPESIAAVGTRTLKSPLRIRLR
jgi:hypothetical protein